MGVWGKAWWVHEMWLLLCVSSQTSTERKQVGPGYTTSRLTLSDLQPSQLHRQSGTRGSDTRTCEEEYTLKPEHKPMGQSWVCP